MRVAWLLVAAVAVVAVRADDEDKESFVPSKFTAPSVEGDVNFFDYFPSASDLGKRWVPSTAKKDDVDSDIAKYNGVWEIAAPSEVSIEGDLGLIVRSKARHHAIAARLDKPFAFDDDEKPLVVQFEVKYEEGQECGGGYVKLLSSGAEKDLAGFQDKTPYTIMFGPDKCSPTGKVHFIMRYKNPKNGTVSEHHAAQPNGLGSSYWDDHKTHLYRLVLHSDGTFAVSVDKAKIISGNVVKDLVPSLTPPQQIADPEDHKPADWDEREEMEDESAVKPDDWDESQPKTVIDDDAVKPSDWLDDEQPLLADPEAVKPSDWDEEMDGEWEPPMVDNPACAGRSGCGEWKRPEKANPLYKGKWLRPRVKNPAYKGIWTPRMVDNPHFFEPQPFAGLDPIAAIGIELWTMSSNIMFDNVLVCGSEEVADELAHQTYAVRASEEARLAAHNAPPGMLQGIVDATKERPWLWAVYVLCVLIPVILISIFCFGKKSTNKDPLEGYKKKTDEPTEDDEQVPNLVDDSEDVIEEEDKEQEEEEQAEEKEEEREQASPAKGGATRADIEDDSGSDSEPAPAPVPEKEKKSPVVTKRKVRRAD